jgi:type IV secretion system protein VirB3
VGVEHLYIMSAEAGNSGARPLYPAYAGLGRTAMFWGVPLMAALVVFTVSVAAALTGAATLGPGGLLLAIPGAPVFYYCRQTCASDDQALRIVWFELLCFFDRTNSRCFGRTYTLAPIRYGRRLDAVKRAFESVGRTSYVSRFYEGPPRTAATEQPEEQTHVHQ